MGKGRRPRRGLLVVGFVAVLALALTACGATPQTALNPQGYFARQPHQLFVVVFWIGVAIFVLVQGLIIYTVVRYRSGPDDDPSTLPTQVHGNTKLEIFWTVVPAVILAAIAVPTVQMIFTLEEKPGDAITIEVIGHRWWWEYRYPAEIYDIPDDVFTANELVIPTDRPVRLEMTAEDPGNSLDKAVIHSFWVPALAGKQDVVPGRTTTLNIQAEDPGEYLGQCAEYCGLSHANMRLRVTALPPDEFRSWLSHQAEPAGEVAKGTRAYQGMKLFLSKRCASCHTIDGAEVTVTKDGEQTTLTAEGRIGPNLTHLMTREEFAGATIDLYRGSTLGGFTDQPDIGNLKAWLDDPEELKPMLTESEVGLGMPEVPLTDEEIDKIVAYLITLD